MRKPPARPSPLVAGLGECLPSLALQAECDPLRTVQARPQGELGIHLAVGAVLLGVGVLLLGIQRHAAGIAALAHGDGGETAQELAAHVSWLLAYLLAGGALLCAVLGVMTYAILARIDQGFAVFG